MSIDKILSKYKKVKGKDFKERIGAFEKFHDPTNIEKQELELEADHIVRGKPSDSKNFPGAYQKAYNILDKSVKEYKDKVNNLDAITSMLETYVDEFLSKIMGDKFSEFVKHAKAEGIDAKELRHAKGNLFARFTSHGDKTMGNILDERIIKELKGKQKIELINYLRNIAAKTVESYTKHVDEEMWEGTFNIYDTVDMAKYVKPKLESKGFTHKDHPLTKHVDDLMEHYELLLRGDTKELVEKHGYKYNPKPKPK